MSEENDIGTLLQRLQDESNFEAPEFTPEAQREKRAAAKKFVKEASDHPDGGIYLDAVQAIDGIIRIAIDNPLAEGLVEATSQAGRSIIRLAQNSCRLSEQLDAERKQADYLRKQIEAQGKQLEAVKYAAERDRLMKGFYNQNSSEVKSLELIAEAVKLEQPVALAYADIDDFGEFNDTYGHDHGDVALRHVAKVAAACFGEGPELLRFRSQGEELTFLVRGLTQDKLAQRMDAFRIRLAESQIGVDEADDNNWMEPYGRDIHNVLVEPYKYANEINITIGVCDNAAIGMQVVGMQVESMPGFLAKLRRLSDANMRIAKAAGKNRVYLGNDAQPYSSQPNL